MRICHGGIQIIAGNTSGFQYRMMHVVFMRKKYAVYSRWEKGKMDDQAFLGRVQGLGRKGKGSIYTHFLNGELSQLHRLSLKVHTTTISLSADSTIQQQLTVLQPKCTCRGWLKSEIVFGPV